MRSIPIKQLQQLWYVLLLCVVSASIYVLSSYPFDDAYIHFRIVRNFVEHGVPYYSIDEPLMSSSSTLWTVFLGILFSIVGVNIKAVALANALFVVANAFVWAKVAVRMARSCKFSDEIVFSLLTCAILFESGFGLMETPLAMLLLGLSWLFYIQGKQFGFFFAALSCFARPELCVYAAGLFVLQFWKRKVATREAVQFFVIGLIPFLLFDLYYFGQILPHTASAKRIVYDFSFADSLGFSIGQLFNIGYISQHIVAFAVYFLFVFLWALVSIFKLTPEHWNQIRESILLERLAWLLVSPLIILFVYALFGVVSFPWYAPIYGLPLLLGIAILGSLSSAKKLLLILLIPFAFRFAQEVSAAGLGVQHSPDFAAGARVRKFLDLGQELSKRYPKSTLLASEIGALGFTFEGTIKDACGLVTPEALKFHPLKVPEERSSGKFGAIPPGYVSELKPDIIVTLPMFAEALLKSQEMESYDVRKTPIFRKDDLERVGRAGVWGQEIILILIRKEKD